MEFFFFCCDRLIVVFFFFFCFPPFSLFQVCELTKLIGESARHNRASVSLVFFFFFVCSFTLPFPSSTLFLVI